MGIKIRKEFHIKVDIAEITKFIGCNPKGIYYIENNFEEIKGIRYLMYLRKRGLNVNKVIDRLNEEDKLNNLEK